MRMSNVQNARLQSLSVDVMCRVWFRVRFRVRVRVRVSIIGLELALGCASISALYTNDIRIRTFALCPWQWHYLVSNGMWHRRSFLWG